MRTTFLMVPQRRRVAAASLLLALGLTAAPPAAAQIMGDLPTIRHVALGPGPSFDPASAPVVLMIQNDSDAYRLVARQIQRSTGEPIGLDIAVALPDGVTPVDMIWSRVLFPNNLLVLDANFYVHRYVVSYDANNQIVLTAPSSGITTYGPYGNPATDGAPTSLAEVPPFLLAIGSTGGKLVIDDGSGTSTVNDLARGPILDLATIPQVNYFTVVALSVEKASGACRLLGVFPDQDPNTPGSQAGVIFNLAAEPQPNPHLLTLAGAAYEPTDAPLQDPAEVNLIAGNGQAVFRVTIPANPTASTTATTSILEFRPVIHLALGSLAMVTADGSGVLYDPGFNLNQGGISGTLLTIYGGSAEVAPATLNLSSRGQFITAVVEIAGGLATDIDPASVSLEVNGSSVAMSGDFAPRFGDEDKDGNPDMKVKFDRAAVQALIPVGASPILMRLRWDFKDGHSGHAMAEVRVLQ